MERKIYIDILGVGLFLAFMIENSKSIREFGFQKYLYDEMNIYMIEKYNFFVCNNFIILPPDEQEPPQSMPSSSWFQTPS